jgi:alpha-glucosidase (family GH31 glycosyl hydrolase)
MMRHLYLDRPHDPNVWGLTDEYMFGDSLLAAPIVKRGATSRSVYLPEPEYYDFFSGARVAAGGNVTVNATLDQVPLFARIGAIIPMLSPDVETLLPATDGSGVISLADRSDVLVTEIFSGGATNVTLADGTKLSQTAPASAYDFASAPQAQNATLVQAAQSSDLATCDACFLDDPASRTMSVTLKTSSDSITIAPLTVTVDSSPNVKRFVMHLHH